MTSSYNYQLIVCVIFLILLFVVSKVVTKKLWFIKIKNGKKDFEVVDKQYINKNSMLLTVKVDGELLLLGVTNQQINLIKKLDSIAPL